MLNKTNNWRRFLQLRVRWLLIELTVLAVVFAFGRHWLDSRDPVIELTIDQAGVVRIDSERVADQDLAAVFAKHAKRIMWWGGEPEAVLRVDPGCLHAKVVSTLDTVASAGFNGVSFAVT